MSHWLKLVLLIIIQLIYVPLLTLRTITMVKNLKVLAAVFGFLEALVYVFGLSIVFSGEQSLIEMLVYALGFALGLFAGVYVEQKMAIGYTSVHVNINRYNPELVSELREKGFGVTVFDAYGKESQRVRLDILTQRKREKELTTTILAFEPTAFIVAYEPKTFQGGYLTKLMKQRRKSTTKRVLSQTDDVREESQIAHSIKEVRRELKALYTTWNKNV